MAEVYPFPESRGDTPVVSSSDPISTGWAMSFPTWNEFRKALSHRTIDFRQAEDLLTCHMAKAFGVDRSIIDEILNDPNQFRDLAITCTEPGKRSSMKLTDASEHYCLVEETQAKREGRMCYWLYWIYGKRPEQRLLYVGITRNRKGREKAHRRNWGDVIGSFDYASYDSHAEVLEAERREIARANPPFNHDHVGGDGE